MQEEHQSSAHEDVCISDEATGGEGGAGIGHSHPVPQAAGNIRRDESVTLGKKR
jgi:hypothetical protein